MENPSNLRSLSQTLALKKAQDSAEVASVTAHELKRLGDDLERQSSTVLTTTAVAITQNATRSMQSAGQQIEQMQREVSERLAKMQAQIDQQLQPLDEQAMKQRMGKLQGQINAQTKPLTEALEKVKRDGQALALMTAKSWIKPAALALTISAAIFLATWGLMQYLAHRIQSNLETIREQQAVLASLQSETLKEEQRQRAWGVAYVENDGKRYLVVGKKQKLTHAGTNNSGNNFYELSK